MNEMMGKRCSSTHVMVRVLSQINPYSKVVQASWEKQEKAVSGWFVGVRFKSNGSRDFDEEYGPYWSEDSRVKVYLIATSYLKNPVPVPIESVIFE